MLFNHQDLSKRPFFFLCICTVQSSSTIKSSGRLLSTNSHLGLSTLHGVKQSTRRVYHTGSLQLRNQKTSVENVSSTLYGWMGKLKITCFSLSLSLSSVTEQWLCSALCHSQPLSVNAAASGTHLLPFIQRGHLSLCPLGQTCSSCHGAETVAWWRITQTHLGMVSF